MIQFKANQDRKAKQTRTYTFIGTIGTLDTEIVDIAHVDWLFISTQPLPLLVAADGILYPNTYVRSYITDALNIDTSTLVTQRYNVQFILPTVQVTSDVSFNDWYLDSSGNIAVVTDIEAIQQSVTAAIWLCLGDYNFNTGLGIPWINILNSMPIDNAFVIYHLKNAILGVNNNIPPQDLPNLRIDDDITINIVSNIETADYNININYSIANGKQLAFSTSTSSLRLGR